MIDVIILSYTKDEFFYQMTLDCIKSLNQSESLDFNILLIETDREYQWQWPDNVTVILADLPFNYNQSLNKGCEFFKNSKSNYIVISNNDVIYHTKWFSNLVKSIMANGLHSASPRTPGWHCHDSYTEETLEEGFNTSYQFCGWCLVFKWEVLRSILPLDEHFFFFYQDNYIANRLQSAGYRHAIIGSSTITHLVSKSNHLLGR